MHGIVLIIGVGRYQELQLSAPETAIDASKLAEVFKQYGAYDQILQLSHEDATRLRVWQAMRRVIEFTHDHADSQVLFFFSGHGMGAASEIDYHLALHDYSSSSPASGSLSAQQLEGWIQALQSNQVLLLFNCCYAGGFLGSRKALGAPLPSTTLDRFNKAGQGRIVISSCLPTEFSYYEPERESFFVTQLLQGLQGRAAGGDKAITGLRLFQDLYAHLPEQVRRLYDLDQHPMLAALTASDFPLLLNVTTSPDRAEGEYSLRAILEYLANFWRRHPSRYVSDHRLAGGLGYDLDTLRILISELNENNFVEAKYVDASAQLRVTTDGLAAIGYETARLDLPVLNSLYVHWSRRPPGRILISKLAKELDYEFDDLRFIVERLNARAPRLVNITNIDQDGLISITPAGIRVVKGLQ